MDIDKLHNKEQEKKDIEMFLAKVDEWNKKIDRKDSISVCSIWDYVESLLEACCSTTTTNSDNESSSQHNLPSIPEQMLDHTGKISSEIAWNAMNNVDSHNSTLSVINILEQFSWEAKVALSIASYILTYGKNGLNLSLGESKLVANSDDELLEFSRKLFKMKYLNNMLKIGLLSSYIKYEDPRLNNVISSVLAVYYSIIRVIVVAASSQLLTRSSRESNDRFDTSTLTWCSKKLDVIQDQLDSALDEVMKVFADLTHGNICQENENEHELILGYPMHVIAPENIDINVVGDTLVLNYTFNDGNTEKEERKIDENKYEKEGITAEWNKYWVYITIPKRKPKPQHIHIPLRITS